MNAPQHPSPEGSAHPDDRIRVRRVPNRAAYSRQAVYDILDEGLVAHVGTVRDGTPVVIPMFYARDGDDVLLHGAPAAGVIRRGAAAEVCVTVTLVDGLVLARSAFHHSLNYRSVVVVGVAEPVTDPEEKRSALDRFVEVMVPGRNADLRPVTQKEINGTGVLRVSLEHSSAKVRTGEPVDDDEDYSLPIWAGVVPAVSGYGAPAPDARVLDGVLVPENVAALQTH